MRWTDFRFPMIYMMITWDGMGCGFECWYEFLCIFISLIFMVSSEKLYFTKSGVSWHHRRKKQKTKQNISCKGFLRRFKCNVQDGEKKKHSKIPNIKEQPVQCTQDCFQGNKHCLDTASVSDYKKVGSYKSFSQNSHRAFLFWKPSLVLLRTSCS